MYTVIIFPLSATLKPSSSVRQIRVKVRAETYKTATCFALQPAVEDYRTTLVSRS